MIKQRKTHKTTTETTNIVYIYRSTQSLVAGDERDTPNQQLLSCLSLSFSLPRGRRMDAAGFKIPKGGKQRNQTLPHHLQTAEREREEKKT